MTAGGVLIDDKGRIWPETSRELVRRIGYRDPAMDLPGYAVRRGLIHIRSRRDGTRVSLCAGRFGMSALAGALRTVHEQAPKRILLAVLREEEWDYGICADVAELAAHAEDLAAERPFQAKPWLAIEKSERVLSSSPSFARIASLAQLWRQRHGRVSADLSATLAASGLLSRSIVARQISGTSRLIYDQFGTGFSGAMRACESMLLIGRELDDYVDRGYGAWVAESYARVAANGRMRLDTCDARIRTTEGKSVRIRYDRVLMPWSEKSGDLVILGISIRRSLASVA
jgi:hypothetical protein